MVKHRGYIWAGRQEILSLPMKKEKLDEKLSELSTAMYTDKKSKFHSFSMNILKFIQNLRMNNVLPIFYITLYPA